MKVHAKKIKIADTVRFDDIAKAAAGASGAELANIVNEAALRAVRDGRKFATQADFEESIEVVIAGYQKKNRVLSNKEKLIVSYHEIGHALVAAKQTESAPVHKITIIPRTSGALGYTMQVDDGEHYLMSKEELEKLEREKYVVERKLTAAMHKEKRLQSELKRLTRSERTHRLCTRAGMLETFLKEPTTLTDDDVMELLTFIFHSEAVQKKLDLLIANRKELGQPNGS